MQIELEDRLAFGSQSLRAGEQAKSVRGRISAFCEHGAMQQGAFVRVSASVRFRHVSEGWEF